MITLYDIKYEPIYNKVKSLMNTYESGHDFYHIERVIRNAKLINDSEHGDWEIIFLASLLHDSGDAKLTGKEDTLLSVPIELMNEFGISKELQDKVIPIINSISFSSGKTVESLEGKIVQDADRLEAIGAIGIARCFSYGGKKGRPMWEPDIEIIKNFENAEAYHNHPGNSLNHFDEKLFKLKDLMNTQTGRAIANQRDAFMREFYEQFKREWKGEESERNSKL